jgi:hypothetical protein
MYTSQFIATVAAGLATLSYAQQSQDNNAAVDILSCTDLDQVDVEAVPTTKSAPSVWE